MRPFIPLQIAESLGAPVSAGGTWIAYDEAASEATYVLGSGQHAMQDDDATSAEPAADDSAGENDTADGAAATPDGTASTKDLPAPGLAAALVALGLTGMATRRRG